jgi:hypothetical protein
MVDLAGRLAFDRTDPSRIMRFRSDLQRKHLLCPVQFKIGNRILKLSNRLAKARRSIHLVSAKKESSHENPEN